MELLDIKMRCSEREMSSNKSYNYDIEIFNLSKNYPLRKRGKYITALKDVSFKVKK